MMDFQKLRSLIDYAFDATPGNPMFSGAANIVQFSGNGIQTGNFQDFVFGALGEYGGQQINVTMSTAWYKQVTDQLSTYNTYLEKGLSNKDLGREAAIYLLMKYGGNATIDVNSEFLQNEFNSLNSFFQNQNEEESNNNQN